MAKRNPSLLPPALAKEVERIGSLIVRLRHGFKIKQEVAATDAGLSRDTASRIENGESGVAIGQILRYVNAISPGSTLKDLLNEEAGIRPAEERHRRVSVSARTSKDEVKK